MDFIGNSNLSCQQQQQQHQHQQFNYFPRTRCLFTGTPLELKFQKLVGGEGGERFLQNWITQIWIWSLNGTSSTNIGSVDDGESGKTTAAYQDPA